MNKSDYVDILETLTETESLLEASRNSLDTEVQEQSDLINMINPAIGNIKDAEILCLNMIAILGRKSL